MTLEKNYHSEQREMAPIRPAVAETEALLARYLKAWEADDVDGLVALLFECIEHIGEHIHAILLF